MKNTHQHKLHDQTYEYIDNHLSTGNCVVIINDTKLVDKCVDLLKKEGVNYKKRVILCMTARKMKEVYDRYKKSWHFVTWQKIFKTPINAYYLILKPLVAEDFKY